MTSPAAAYSDHLARDRRRSAHTVRAYRATAERLLAFLGAHWGASVSLKRFAGLEASDVRAFMAARRIQQIGGRSLMRALAGLRSFARFLEREGKGKVGALSAIRAPKVGKSLPKPIAVGAAKELTDADLRAGENREPWIWARDAAVIPFPTRVATIVGRWAVDGEDDLPAVHALQDALALTPLEPSGAAPEGVPAVPEGPSEALTFFERMRVWSQAFPPAEHDREALASYHELGITGAAPIADQPDAVRAALEAGYAVGKEALEASLRTGVPLTDGWQLNLHAFDYNTDFLGIGTIDAPEWTMADPKTRYAHRAAAALGGLWGNHAYEAAYVATYVDADGDQLSGEHVYRLRLHPTPPVDAFWSLTMYDLPHYFLVANPIGRYSLGDRTRGIVYDDDGGLTITMSATRPTDEKAAANWLPAPEGPFRPMLRLYAPREDVLTGAWRLSPIEKVA